MKNNPFTTMMKLQNNIRANYLRDRVHLKRTIKCIEEHDIDPE